VTYHGTRVISGAGTAYPSGAPAFTPFVVSGVRVTNSAGLANHCFVVLSVSPSNYIKAFNYPFKLFLKHRFIQNIKIIIIYSQIFL
jgi:hypothetical protein